METKSNTGFSVLFARGTRLFGNTLGTNTTWSVLSYALPGLIVSIAFYYMMAFLLQPIFVLLRTVIMTAFETGFDEMAIERALDEVVQSMEHWDGLNNPWEVLGMMAGGVLVCLPISILAHYVLVPLSLGAMTNTLSRAYFGVKLRFGASFALTKGRRGRMIVLILVLGLAQFAIGMLGGIVSSVLSWFPILGSLMSIVISLAIGAVSMSITCVTFITAINEDKWHFDALSLAVKRIFTDWRYLTGAAVQIAIVYALCFVTVIADLVLMLLYMLPPFITMLLSVFLVPWYLAYATAVYYKDKPEKEKIPGEFPNA